MLYAEKKAKNVNPFKRVVFSKSVEAEAVKAFAAKKKMEAQQKELIAIIGMTYGKQGLLEFRDIRNQMIKQRQDTVYRQEELREQLLAGFLTLVMIAIVVGTALFIVSG